VPVLRVTDAGTETLRRGLLLLERWRLLPFKVKARSCGCSVEWNSGLRVDSEHRTAEAPTVTRSRGARSRSDNWALSDSDCGSEGTLSDRKSGSALGLAAAVNGH
jgi:hypothetical protein